MKKTTLTVFLGLCTACTMAQTVTTPAVVSPGGKEIASGGAKLMTTIAEESATTSVINSNGVTLTQGFEQPANPKKIISGLLDLETTTDGKFVVYPVPASNNVWYAVTFPESGQVAMQVFDMQGRLLDNIPSQAYGSNNKLVASINTLTYASGTYILKAVFTSGQQSSKTISKQFIINK